MMTEIYLALGGEPPASTVEETEHHVKVRYL